MDAFSDQEKLEQAVGNAIAMYVATVAFLEERGVDPAELDRFFGEKHAEGWAEARGDLKQMAHYVALNMATFGFSTDTTHEDGGVVVTARWSDDHADPDWPIPVKPALSRMPIAFEPIMSWLGVDFTWEADDDGLVLRMREGGP
jgi:hypothetical protein